MINSCEVEFLMVDHDDASPLFTWMMFYIVLHRLISDRLQLSGLVADPTQVFQRVARIHCMGAWKPLRPV